jgi:small subunit ribosomal protein S21
MDSDWLFCYSPPTQKARHCGAFDETRPSHNEGASVQVLVRDNNVDQALKALKKKMQREGIFREMKLRGHYEKPSEKKAREKAEAIRRARKLARKKMQREGLLPAKPRVVPGAGAGPGAGGRGGERTARGSQSRFG